MMAFLPCHKGFHTIVMLAANGGVQWHSSSLEQAQRQAGATLCWL